jgi:hypothetical protein
MSDVNYVYVVVREDLSPEQQAVQAVHAALMAGSVYGSTAAQAHVVLARVQSLASLQNLALELTVEDVGHQVFFEPDNDVGYSALATIPLPASSRARRLFKKLPLVVIA